MIRDQYLGFELMYQYICLALMQVCCFMVSFGGGGGGWVSWRWGGVGDGCMESVQFVSQVHGRCSVKLVLGTGGVCEILTVA